MLPTRCSQLTHSLYLIGFVASVDNYFVHAYVSSSWSYMHDVQCNVVVPTCAVVAAVNGSSVIYCLYAG
jgi:hypothetical protein